MRLRDGRRVALDMGPLPCVRAGGSLSGRAICCGSPAGREAPLAAPLPPEAPEERPEPSGMTATDRARAWRHANPEAVREAKRKWRESHREAIREADRRRAAARRAAA